MTACCLRANWPSGLRIGVLFNFHARLLKDGLRRFVI